jgi:uncharacterized protein
VSDETPTTTYAKPLPRKRPIDEPYWDGAKEGVLRIQQCQDCQTWFFPPSEFCPEDLSHNWEWKEASGKGTIWTRIFMHQMYYRAFADDIPYNVVWVKLDEGPMITSCVVGSPNEEIEVDRRVEVVFDAVTDDVVLPKFRLV